MCGIFGYVSKKIDKSILEKSNKIQSHRGPDGQEFKCIKVGSNYVGLSHQRLSIIDLTPAGSQPMVSRSGNEVISYNGEIYNYKELLKSTDLEAEVGDTRVLLEILSKYGINSCKNLNGMWAFAFLDLKKGELILSRDRFGEKPLYYFEDGGSLYFSSELKTIIELVPKKFQLDYQVLGEFLDQGLINFSQDSIFKGVSQVRPGSSLIFDLNDNLNKTEKVYWTPPLVSDNKIDLNSAIDEIGFLFDDAVKIRLRSDVPIAVLLSGGIDSSSITASMVSQVPCSDVQTISALNNFSGMDERDHIDLMNSYLNVISHPVYVNTNPNESFELIKFAIKHNDMPIADFSNVAHLLLMKKALSMGIKVILSGQGADELFCGYKKYLGFYAQDLLRKGKIVEFSNTILSFILKGTILKQFNLSEAIRYLPFKSKQNITFGEKMRNYSPVQMGLQNGMSIMKRQIYDLQKTSVPALTHYEDRMSMANGIEIRLPFLDYRLVELALKLPVDFKIRSGWTKYIFRKSVQNKLPPKITWRKDKQGFLNPQNQLLKNEWKPMIKDYFSKDSIIFKYGIFEHRRLNRLYDDFCNGKNVWYRNIFTPLTLEIWLRQNETKLEL